MKAIFVREIRKGDIIRFNERREVVVRGTMDAQHGPTDDVFVHVFGEDGLHFVLQPGDIVGLIHRPLPKGRTRQHLWWGILDGARAIVNGTPGPEMVRRCQELREVLEEADLAEPPEAPTTVDGEVGPGYPTDAMPLG